MSIDTERLIFRLDGHAGYAPAGQDIVCASASMLAAALFEYVLDGVDKKDICECEMQPGHAVLEVYPRRSGEIEHCRHAFGMACVGFELLAKRYPEHVIID